MYRLTHAFFNMGIVYYLCGRKLNAPFGFTNEMGDINEMRKMS